MNEFVGFPKISRWSRDATISEKLDGTNGSIFIGDDRTTFLVGSRTRWITIEEDNHGFARWAYEHRDELIQGLGPGRHFGEWWGGSIQRGYGVKDKRFSLFNTTRWTYEEAPPACCRVVPVVVRGAFGTVLVENAMDILLREGSLAAPGFMAPEGIVIYHAQGNVAFKKTFAGDEAGKGQ